MSDAAAPLALTLSPAVSALLRQAMEKNGFATPEEFVAHAALALGDPLFGYTPEELDRLIQEGEESGEALDGPAAIAELLAKLQSR